MSKKGVLRGLHFQYGHPQGKLVRVLMGEVFDVAVDIRPDSPTSGPVGGGASSRQRIRNSFMCRRDSPTGSWY